MINKIKSLKDMIVKLLLLTIVSFSGLKAQEAGTIRNVSGVVTEYLGAFPGVSVVVKGTNISTSSDINGKYTLNVPENAILRFSALGYATQEIDIENKQVINVFMVENEYIGIPRLAQPVNLTEKQREKVEADNSFAFNMFREVSRAEGENTFFSPFSLNMALGMLYNGSSGNTRTEMVNALGMANFSEYEINEYNQKILHSFLELDPSTDLVIANSIWYRNELSVKTPFIETTQKYLDADVRALDFSSPDAANTINNWIADKTRNRFNNIVASPMPVDMMMYLANALYFKSNWQIGYRFDKTKTKLSNFTKTNRRKMKVHLMEQTTFLPYYADRYLQCVELPYGNQAFSMLAILSVKNMNINQLIEYLDNVKLDNAVSSIQRQRVWLKLPRFKIECEFSLNQPLMDLGIRQIFQGGFANISDDELWVSKVRQKTFVEVNEEGTEAAALTDIVMVGAGGRRRVQSRPIRFFADRPFLFLIKEKSTGLILFVGRIDEPVE